MPLESIAKSGLCFKTHEVYMIDNQGHYIYKFETGTAKQIAKAMRKQPALKVSWDNKAKVYILWFSDKYGTKHFSGVFM